MISCQLHVDKTNRGTSRQHYTHTPALSPDPLLLLAFLFFFTLLSPEARDLLPSLKWHSLGAGACTCQSIIKLSAYAGVWHFFAFWKLPCHPPAFSRTPFPGSSKRGRAGAILSYLANPLAAPPLLLWLTPLALGHTARAKPSCFNRIRRQGSNGKRTENWKVAKHTPFSSSLSRLCLFYFSGVLLVCFPVYFSWESAGVQGCGTRTLGTSKGFGVAVSHEIPLQSPWLWNQHRLFAFPPSVCFHWLEPAFFQFLPFLGCQLTPVNTNNIDASAFWPQLWKQILTPAELWLFTISWLLLLLPQNIPHTNAMPSSRSQDEVFHIYTYWEHFSLRCCHPDTVVLAWSLT